MSFLYSFIGLGLSIAKTARAPPGPRRRRALARGDRARAAGRLMRRGARRVARRPQHGHRGRHPGARRHQHRRQVVEHHGRARLHRVRVQLQLHPAGDDGARPAPSSPTPPPDARRTLRPERAPAHQSAAPSVLKRAKQRPRAARRTRSRHRRTSRCARRSARRSRSPPSSTSPSACSGARVGAQACVSALLAAGRARAGGGPGELTCGGAPQVRRVWQQQPRHARQPALRRRLHRPLVRPRAARAARAARPGALPAARCTAHARGHRARSWLLDIANAAIFVHLLGARRRRAGPPAPRAKRCLGPPDSRRCWAQVPTRRAGRPRSPAGPLRPSTPGRAALPAPMNPTPSGGAAQVWTQPLFSFVEERIFMRFPDALWMQKDLAACAPARACGTRAAPAGRPGPERGAARRFHVPGLGLFRINVFRLLWRSFYVCVTTLLAALLPARPRPARPTCRSAPQRRPRAAARADARARAVLQRHRGPARRAGLLAADHLLPDPGAPG